MVHGELRRRAIHCGVPQGSIICPYFKTFMSMVWHAITITINLLHTQVTPVCFYRLAR